MKIKHVAAAMVLAVSMVVPAMATVLDTADNVTFGASYTSLGGNNWALTVDVNATANTIGANFLNAISIVPGGSFSNVSMSASDGTWGTVQNGPTSSSDSCGGVAQSAFCFAATDSGASTAKPIEFVFDFTDAGVDLSGPHVQVSWDVNGNHFSEQVPTTSTVPEPSSLLLMGTGALGFFGPIRRKLLPHWKR
jgi:hypothetical protein